MKQATNIFRSLTKDSNKYAEKAQWMLVEIAWERNDWKSLVIELQNLKNMNGELATRAIQLLEIVEQIANGKLNSMTY